MSRNSGARIALNIDCSVSDIALGSGISLDTVKIPTPLAEFRDKFEIVASDDCSEPLIPCGNADK